MKKIFPEADAYNDCNLLVTDKTRRLNKLKKKLIRNWDVVIQKSVGLKAYTKNIEENLENLRQRLDTSEKRNTIRNLMLKVLEENVGDVKEKRDRRRELQIMCYMEWMSVRTGKTALQKKGKKEHKHE